MTTFAGLLLPAANAVYRNCAPRLSLAELEIFGERALGGRLRELCEITMGGVPYVSFCCDALEPRDVSYLANLSSLYALFEVVDGDLLRPVPLRGLDRFETDLITIPKYRGKTNEQFTKLLLNVTVLASDFAEEMLTRRLRVLDPLAGRGTTLNQALMYGWDCAGVDIDGKSIEEYQRFIVRYLKDNRFKHRLRTSDLRLERQVVGRRLDVDVGLNKETFAAGDAVRITALHADTGELRTFFKAESFDVIVTDLPYGVRHRSRQAGRGRSSTPRQNPRQKERRPVELLESALPLWAEVLRPGGALGISWNRHVAGREKVVSLVESAGLELVRGAAYGGFKHSVDQSIVRDLVVARKTVAVRR